MAEYSATWPVQAAYYCEEGPVTFQLGMIARDGILLASDSLVVSATGIYPVDTVPAEKIVVHSDKKLAYCCAGDGLASAIGAAIAGRLHDPQLAQSAEFLTACAVETMAEPARQASWYGGAILVVGGTPPALWKIEANKISGEPPTVGRVPGGYTATGERFSYARYFCERYFPNTPKPTLAQLLPLAAHTVLSASGLSPSAIRGLELVLCTSAGFERLDQGSLNELEQLSWDLDHETAKRLRLSAQDA